jgi:REP element-mobilizing transposase RayT
MGRPKRIQYPGACYYLTLSGNNRQNVFISNQDRRHFLHLLRSRKARYGLKVYAYCLMESFVELVVETAQPNLSAVMQTLSTAYTKYFNSQHDCVGHVFQGRYKSLLVDKARLLDLSVRVHLTPAREGVRERPWRYLWSSCASFVEAEERDLLVDSEDVLSLLAKNRLKQSVVYMKRIKDAVKSGPPALETREGRFVGDEAFAEAALKAAGEPRCVRGPASAAAALALLAEVASRRGVREEDLVGRSQRREISCARREAAYRLWKEAGLGVGEVARMIHRTPSAVSQIIRKVEENKDFKFDTGTLKA